ncbi:hypothetical protein [Rhizobium sp. ZX09]|uniref:hypothetical protein n=1 Tax=Rhizobium sp. ZX09 TaxID=2291939 RepID=UPI001A98A5D4|nr:hypothetical protein [Rhizobium sp. ZX09]QSZ57221.1 hypothetical protein BTN45_08950 [Rhizobium sp. ZX09]
MANDIRGEVGFKALEKDWKLKLGNGAIRHVENETGKSFPQVGKELSNSETASISLLTQVFHAALIQHHPDITIEGCDDIIDEIGHEKAGTLLGKAFQLMQPKAPKGGDVRPRKATAG